MSPRGPNTNLSLSLSPSPKPKAEPEPKPKPKPEPKPKPKPKPKPEQVLSRGWKPVVSHFLRRAGLGHVQVKLKGCQ